MIEKLSLTELQLIIRDSLYLSLPEMYWVFAEISEIKENYAGHCYLELIEKQSDQKNVSARIRAVVWNNRYRFLKAFFENITGETLKEGLKILIKVKVEYHEVYGLSLVISDIDPAFTIGELAIKRQMIIKKLEEEGVFTMNKDLEFPLLPQRIAIISSKSAAGYSDFMSHLSDNNSGYVFYTALFESAMQGQETEEGIINALDKIAENAHIFDLVVIIRGGGSQTDLSWFDSYNIAYYITQFPLPVITGIGHDKDLSVTDMVANVSLKTPTAAADFIINCVTGVENHLNELSSDIKTITETILEKYRSRIESSMIRLFPLTQIMISGIRDKVSGKIIEIINIGKEFTSRAGQIPLNQGTRLISATKSFSSGKRTILEEANRNLNVLTINALISKKLKIDSMESMLGVLKPENVLRRGYTITSLNGRILKKTTQVMEDDIIDTKFSDGSVCSRVFKRNT